MLPIQQSKSRPWWMYLVFALAAIGVLAAAAVFTGVVWISFILSRLVDHGNAGTPDISGKVVDIVTSEPVPGMNVCLLETYTYSGPTDGSGPHPDVRRGEVTQTDAVGSFSFAASKASLGLVESRDRYSISITEPVGDLVCGLDMSSAMGGRGRLFQNDPSPAARRRQRHYFPMAIVDDPRVPPPVGDIAGMLVGSLPADVFYKKIGDPAKLRIELIPLLQNESECDPALDAPLVELCKRANSSDSAKRWRAAPKNSP